MNDKHGIQRVRDSYEDCATLCAIDSVTGEGTYCDIFELKRVEDNSTHMEALRHLDRNNGRRVRARKAKADKVQHVIDIVLHYTEREV